MAASTFLSPGPEWVQRPVDGPGSHRVVAVEQRSTPSGEVANPAALVWDVQGLTEVVPEVLSRRQWSELGTSRIERADEAHFASATDQAPGGLHCDDATKRPSDQSVRRFDGQLIEHRQRAINPIVDAPWQIRRIDVRRQNRENRMAAKSVGERRVVAVLLGPGVNSDQRRLVPITAPTPRRNVGHRVSRPLTRSEPSAVTTPGSSTIRMSLTLFLCVAARSSNRRKRTKTQDFSARNRVLRT